MKKFLLIALTGLSLVSCTKKVSTPGAASQNIFFQSADVVVENMIAVQTTTSSVTVNFSTAFENNLSRIELMSSADNSTFCTSQAVDVTNNSSAKKGL